LDALKHKLEILLSERVVQPIGCFGAQARERLVFLAYWIGKLLGWESIGVGRRILEKSI